jgi:hypothetical protein
LAARHHALNASAPPAFPPYLSFFPEGAGMTRVWRPFVVALLTMFSMGAAAAEPPLIFPFDFSRHAIGVDVTVKGKPLFMLLDTGVEPSIVALARAKPLKLPLDLAQASEGSGFGSAKAESFPATIRGLQIGGRAFGDVEALAVDTEAISKGYGRPVDGVLGYSFLKDKTLLIDYPASTVTVLPGAKDADTLTQRCRKHDSIPLLFLGDNHWPVIEEFRIGDRTLQATLDTGSSRMIGFFETALQIKEIRDALKVTGTNSGAGFGGKFTSRTAVLGVPVGFGPFRLPAGATVSLLPTKGQSNKVVANIGNAALAEMTPKLLLDYAGKTISFYGDCAH